MSQNHTLTQQAINKKRLYFQLNALNDNIINFKLAKEKDCLDALEEDLVWMESQTPNRKISIEDLRDMIKEQKSIVNHIEEYTMIKLLLTTFLLSIVGVSK